MNYLNHCHNCNSMLKLSQEVLSCDKSTCIIQGCRSIYIWNLKDKNCISNTTVQEFNFVTKLNDNFFRFSFHYHDFATDGKASIKKFDQMWKEIIQIKEYEFKFQVEYLLEEVTNEIKRLIILSNFQ